MSTVTAERRGTGYPRGDRRQDFRAKSGISTGRISSARLASTLLSGPRTSQEEAAMNGAGLISQSAAYVPKRKADRRTGFNDLVREVATDCLAHSTPNDLRTILVAKLRRLVQAKTVQFSELPGTPSLRV